MNKALLLLLAVLGLAGCSNQPAPAKKPNVAVAMGRPRTDPTRLAAEAIRQATEPSHFREALNLLNPLLETSEAQSRLQLPEKQREFLQTQVHLTDDEVAEVEASSFRPADAYYLEECSLLRDAAQALEVGGLNLPEQGRLCLHWVARHVLLQDQGQEWLPNAFVLKRGYGDARARGLIFLALMRQFQAGKQSGDHPAEGCVLVVSGANPRPVLVGLLDEASQDLYLFDPRLAEPVRKASGAVATLKDVRQDPTLLKTAGVSPAQVKELQAWLACPLPALAPRIQELERILSSQDRLKLFLDAQAQQQKFAKALALPVRIWNSPAEPGGKVANSPTRALRLFLPAEDGGVDRSVPPRLAQFTLHLFPWPSVALALEQLRLTQDLVEPARKFLTENLSAELFKRYYQQPTELLLHGRYDPMLSRLDRIRPFLEDDTLASLAENKKFPREVAAWRDKANASYLAVLNKDASAKGQTGVLWNEDQYLIALLSDSEDAAEQAKKLEKGTLTRILAYVGREPLQQRSAWLLACCWQEKAERAQAGADVDKGKAAARKAHKAWLNAKGAWNLYLGRIALGAAGLSQRLEPVRERLKAGDPERAVSQLEALDLDLQRYYVAKLALGDALVHLDGGKPALAYLQSVGHEMDALLDGAGPGTVSLKPEIARVQQTIARLPNTALRANLQQRADLLARDWTAHGAFTALRQRIDLVRSTHE
jgi:hypothetical protein